MLINEFITHTLSKPDYGKFIKNLNPKFYSSVLKILYFFNTLHSLNLKNPQLFTEKIQWIKLLENDKRKARLADKLKLRDYLFEKLGSDEYSPIVYGVWNSFDEMIDNCDFSKIPEPFVLKANHSCASNFVVREKEKFLQNSKIIRKIVNGWLKKNFAYNSLELQYKDIRPKVYIEEFLQIKNEKHLSDYRFNCFNGEPKYIERFKDGTCSIYDSEWRKMPFSHTLLMRIGDEPAPKNLEKMLEIAKILSKNFNYVRVDFVETDAKLYVMEMTFTPCSGFMRFYPQVYNAITGDMLVL